jgi:hypothetical protein
MITELLRKFGAHLPVDIEAKREARKDRREDGGTVFADEQHLMETAAWLCRAQDSSPDGGVSRAYKAAYYLGYGPSGWQPSYPETTGYIIPTMFAIADFLKDASFAQRAIRMADWEIDIQLPSGAVMGSVVTATPSPAVFNTGQVIFGWLATYRRTGEDQYLQAARRAGNYLVQIQDSEGSWKQGDSLYALSQATTYNTRVSWSLVELGLLTKHDGYIDAARENIEFALKKQNTEGWFADNCLNDPERPLLHTIAYATRGVLECGYLMENQNYIDSALKTLEGLLSCQRSDGGLPGRLTADWKAAVDWDCVTGDAQTAVNWLRAYSITGCKTFHNAARKTIDFLKKTQNLDHLNPGIRGGVKGSFPFDGIYGQYELLNWAAKFFCDALLMICDNTVSSKGIRG